MRTTSLLLAALLSFTAGCLRPSPGQGGRVARVSLGVGRLADVAPGTTAVHLTVTAADMAQVAADLPLDGSVMSLEIPSGADRRFTADAFAGPVRTHTGSTVVAELVAGQVLRISIPLELVVADTTPPAVTAVDPASGALDVATGAQVTASFSEAVDPATVTPSTFWVTLAGVPVAGSLAVAGNLAVFTPAAPLLPLQQYTAHLASAIQDLAGNGLAAPLDWTFTTSGTVLDTTPPTLVSGVPEFDAIDVSATSSVSFTFSEPIDPATVGPLSFAVVAFPDTLAGTYQVTGSTITFTPLLPLAPGLLHTVVLFPTIADLAGNTLTGVVNWQFTTELPAPPAPTVASSSPADQATWVPYDAPIAVDFSEAMDAATLDTSTFTLVDGLGAPVAGSVGASGTRATFIPAARLCNPCSFTATVTTGARSQAGAPLAADHTFAFSTGRAPDQAPARLGGSGVTSLVIAADGSAYAWGTNFEGALGTADPVAAARAYPAPVLGVAGAQAIDGAVFYSMALLGDGSVLDWGQAERNGTAAVRLQAAPVAGLTGIKAISAGYRNALALASDGTVWGFGLEDPLLMTPIIGDFAARRLDGLADVVAVAAGEQFSMVLRSDGVVLAWGRNAEGELGDGGTTSRATPAPVPGLTGVTAIAAQSFTGAALRHDGTVWSWGFDNVGQTGAGSVGHRLSPVQVLTGVTAIATGNSHTLALMQDQTVKAWGNNPDGRLGDGTLSNRSAAVTVGSLAGVVEISGGEFHSLARTVDGTIWSWGENGNAQLGDGTLVDRLSPVRVLGLNLEDPSPRRGYAVSGTVAGLTGSGLVLQLNFGGELLSVDANGAFGFLGELTSGTPYVVSVATQPSLPDQGCSVTHGIGTIGVADVTDVLVECL